MKTWIPVALMILQMSACYVDAPTCGDGRLDPGEACDGIYFASDQQYSCAQLGYNGTMLAGCTASCRIDPSPCEITGRCGDGVLMPGYEECDGADFGDEDCISLGHHGGALACTGDCRVDVSGCTRCGDGIVQELSGELLESNVSSCLDDGHFGGFLYTEDCVHTTEEICGDFALIPFGGSLSDPVFAQTDDGTVHLGGRVLGTFDGFANPGCPREKDLVETWYDGGNPYQQVVGTYHDPDCAMEFLALRSPGALERVLGQVPPDAPVVAMTAFGEDGVARIRRGEPDYRFELADADGAVRFSRSLGMLGIGQLPRAVRLDGTSAGISAVDHAGVHFAQIDLMDGTFTPLGFAADFTAGDQLYQFDVYQDHAASWVDATEVFFVAALTPWESGQGGRKALFRGRFDDLGWTLERLFGLDPVVAASIRLVALHVSPELDRVELAWVDAGAGMFHRGQWSLSGTPGPQQALPLPAHHAIESLHRAADGTYVLGGTTWMADQTLEAPNACRPSSASLAVLRADADAGTWQARYFLTSAAHPQGFEVDFCHFDRRHYAFDGATLLVGGAYDRAAGFCSDHEVADAGARVPLHACGIYLVRLPLP
ncbi:MAG: hypothetical protein CVU59_08790 [Deltaproteobacteria bacterium HGW-Deltaproteobacteria-17]|nr:MAG: hypothetical protein CVU59_08790 [Deltaproteobacteria bacterium HGW-Deltaproteobacteria-17]